MILKKNKNHPDYYQFKNFNYCSGLAHGVFTRKGGVSHPPFNSLNVSFSTGDSRDNVVQNRAIILKCLGFQRSLYLNQVHGKDFALFSKKDAGSDCCRDVSTVVDADNTNTADGLITNIPGILLVIQVADCQAVILYDPVKKVLANIHSGWRGSILNIIGSGVDIMVETFGSNSGDILAAISPCLGPCCSEFINYRDEIPKKFWKYRISDHYFDFRQISRHQLEAKGILPGHIEMARLCTKCTSDTFFSYRKKKITGRFAVAAGLI